jgi:hypothetical protein
MNTFLASLMLIAAGEVAPPPPVPDAEVVRYLKANELVEWNNSMRINAAGEIRIKQGKSILTTSGGAAAANKGPRLGGLTETPEQVTVRAQKIIDEGTAQVRQALPSLTRLRAAAALRAAEKTKPINFSVELAPVAWSGAVTPATVRLQKQARDTGFTKVHLLGAISLLGDGKLARPPEISTAIRNAWSKGDDGLLATAPEDGYAYIPAVAPVAASLGKGMKPATAPKQVAILWAEYYALSADGNRGLFFLRLADAFTMRLIGSEVVYTEVGVLAAPTGVCEVSLRDDRSFVPRLAESGDWVLGFDRASHPLGSALLAHLSVTQTKLGVAAAPYVVIVAGGGPAGTEGVGAKWRAVAVTSAIAGVSAFQITSIPNGAEGVEVGQLTLKLGAPAATK